MQGWIEKTASRWRQRRSLGATTNRPLLIYSVDVSSLKSARSTTADATQALEFEAGSGLTFALYLTLLSLIGAVGLYSAGVFLEHYFPYAKPYDTAWGYIIEIPKKLSEAVLIAWVLNLSVEYIARKRHQRQAAIVEGYLESQRQLLLKNMSKDVFSAVYEMNMPPSVFTTVRNSVFLCGFFRSNYIVDLDMHRVTVKMNDGNHDSRVKLRVRQQYDTKNISTLAGVQRLTVRASIDHRKYGRPDVQESQFLYFSILLLNHLGEAFGSAKVFGKEELAKLIKTSQDNRFETLEMDVDLLNGWSARVDVIYNQYHPTDGADMVCCMHPADGIEINATVPNQDFLLDLYSLHPLDEKDESEANCIARRRWRVGPGILPGHGVFFSWRPVANPSSQIERSELNVNPNSG